MTDTDRHDIRRIAAELAHADRLLGEADYPTRLLQIQAIVQTAKAIATIMLNEEN